MAQEKTTGTTLNDLFDFSEFEIEEHTLPHPDDVTYYVLEKQRKIFLDYDIGVEVMPLVRMILRWNMEDRGVTIKSRKPIMIYIHSYGGSLDYMWDLIGVIEASETPVYTVNVGKCCSAASLIFMSGHKRFMTKRAIVLIHEGSASMNGDSTKVLDASDSYRKELKKMKDYILERTRISPRVLNKKRNNDWEIDAEFCLANGVCDQIIDKISDVI